jgi:hypothetical protein
MAGQSRSLPQVGIQVVYHILCAHYRTSYTGACHNSAYAAVSTGY